MLLLCWQQYVVAMEMVSSSVLLPWMMRCQPDNTTLWPQCIAALMYSAPITQRVGHNVLHKNTHTHTAVAYNTTLWPQSIAPKHTHTVAREDFITQRCGHNVLHPNTHTHTALACYNTTLWPQCIGPITQCSAHCGLLATMYWAHNPKYCGASVLVPQLCNF